MVGLLFTCALSQSAAVPPAPEIKTAYHFLQASDVRGPDWPRAFEGTDLFVCNASMGDDAVRTIRTDFPDAVLLAGTSAQDAFIHVHDTDYYRDLSASFDSSLCVRNLDDDTTVRIYPWDPAHPERSVFPFFVMSPDAARTLAEFHRMLTMHRGWDGLYIDMCTIGIPQWRKEALLRITPNFDIDRDGEPDSLRELDAQYAAWRPYFTELLRIALPDAILVANTDGPLDDPALNGITLESVGNRFSVVDAKSWFLSQQDVSVPPWVSVAWAVSETDRPGCREVADDLPFVHFGLVSE